jgi:hypothetical protein
MAKAHHHGKNRFFKKNLMGRYSASNLLSSSAPWAGRVKKGLGIKPERKNKKTHSWGQA